MPYSSAQWRAIAATTMEKYGPEKGRKKLHEYKEGGHAVDHRKDKKRRRKLKKWMKHHA